jgi:uncharacterized protein YjbI with pentapeptide repeats
VNDPPSNEEQQQSQQEQRSRRDGLPAGWRYYDQAKHRSRLRGWIAQVWRGAKNNAALLSLVGVLLTLLVTTLLTQLEWSHQQAVENQRAKAERKLAAARAQDERLQAYFDQMTSLLLEKNLRDSEENSEVRTLARVRTLTVLETLDPSRKTAVVQFLVEAGLVQRVEGRDPIIGRDPIVGLSGADLSGADLREADLRGADLSEADLRYTNLRYADLSDSLLSGANLSGAYLNFANLSRAVLNNADLPDADLSGAYMSDVFLRYANLREAVLVETNLSDTDLLRADLGYARMNGAEGITNEELEQQAASLKGATMPNGQKYEEWLRSKDRAEDG